MASWQRCDRCRRVLPEQEYDGDSTTCRACLTLPVARPAAARAGTVTRRRTAPRAVPAPAAPAPAGPRPALLGVTGSGDLEMRERRARRASLEALALAHAEDFAALLRDARLVEGLRTTNTTEPTEPTEPISDDSDGGATEDS